jgi:hypothetical protein
VVGAAVVVGGSVVVVDVEVVVDDVVTAAASIPVASEREHAPVARASSSPEAMSWRGSEARTEAFHGSTTHQYEGRSSSRRIIPRAGSRGWAGRSEEVAPIVLAMNAVTIVA